MIFEHFSWKEVLTCFMVLFAVIDIIGSIPIIVSLKQKFGQIEAEKASVVAGILMIIFLFVGWPARPIWPCVTACANHSNGSTLPPR